VPYFEILEATGVGTDEINGHLDILERYKLLWLETEGPPQPTVYLRRVSPKSKEWEWGFWSDIKVFCERTGNDVSQFVEQLRFDLLD
jgi:hypothetical protein